MSAAEIHPDRTSYLGSHAFAAIVGKHPFVSPMDLYCQMKRLVEQKAPAEHMAWGLRLEKAILDHYVVRKGNMALARNIFKLHDTLPFIGGTADGLAANMSIGVDAKNIAFKGDEWGTPGTDDVPLYIKAQCHHFNMLFDTDAWEVAVLQHGQRYDEYVVERDREMDDIIITTLRDFWDNNIMAEEPPELDGSEGAKNYLAAKYPRQEEEIREATLAEAELLDAYRDNLEAQALLELKVKEQEHQIKHSIANAEGLIFPGGKVTWKTQKGRSLFDTEGLKESHPDLAEKYTKQGAPIRVFRKSFKD